MKSHVAKTGMKSYAAAWKKKLPEATFYATYRISYRNILALITADAYQRCG